MMLGGKGEGPGRRKEERQVGGGTLSPQVPSRNPSVVGRAPECTGRMGPLPRQLCGPLDSLPRCEEEGRWMGRAPPEDTLTCLGEQERPGRCGNAHRLHQTPCLHPVPSTPPHSSEHLILWFFQDSKNKKAKKGKRQ